MQLFSFKFRKGSHAYAAHIGILIYHQNSRRRFSRAKARSQTGEGSEVRTQDFGLRFSSDLSAIPTTRAAFSERAHTEDPTRIEVTRVRNVSFGMLGPD